MVLWVAADKIRIGQKFRNRKHHVISIRCRCYDRLLGKLAQPYMSRFMEKELAVLRIQFIPTLVEMAATLLGWGFSHLHIWDSQGNYSQIIRIDHGS